MTRIIAANAEPVEIPLRHTFATAQDRLARQVSRLVRLTLTLDDGSRAIGECVPVQYVTGETQASALAIITAALPALIGRSIDCTETALADVESAVSDQLAGLPMTEAAASARAAIEMALWDGLCTVGRIAAWSLFGGARREAMTDVTIPITDDAVDVAMRHAELGFRCFKVKLGRADTSADLAQLISLHRVMPEASFRLDANQAFTPDGALRFVDRALAAGLTLECLEQPVAKHDLMALDAVAARSPVPVFADEAVRTPEDAYRIVSETRVHGLNVKLMKSGIAGGRAIASVARAAGRRLMIGCMLETRRGIGWALALAAGMGAFDLYDLDSHMLLMEDETRSVSEGSNVAFAQDGPVLRISPR